MDNKFLAKFGEEDSNIDKILNRSTRAVCGITEREIMVKKENIANVKSTLKSKGFFIVGTSEKGPSSRKVWFIKRGGL